MKKIRHTGTGKNYSYHGVIIVGLEGLIYTEAQVGPRGGVNTKTTTAASWSAARRLRPLQIYTGT